MISVNKTCHTTVLRTYVKSLNQCTGTVPKTPSAVISDNRYCETLGCSETLPFERLEILRQVGMDPKNFLFYELNIVLANIEKVQTFRGGLNTTSVILLEIAELLKINILARELQQWRNLGN